MSFERVVGLKPTTLALEGRRSSQLSYTRKSVTNFGFIRHFIVNEVIKPANNTGVSLYVKLSPQNISFSRQNY